MPFKPIIKSRVECDIPSLLFSQTFYQEYALSLLYDIQRINIFSVIHRDLLFFDTGDH